MEVCVPPPDALGVAIVVEGEGNDRVVGPLINTTDEPQTLVGADVDSERGPVRAAVGFFVELTLEIEDAAPPDGDVSPS